MKRLVRKTTLSEVGKLLVFPNGRFAYSNSTDLGEAAFALEPGDGTLEDGMKYFYRGPDGAIIMEFSQFNFPPYIFTSEGNTRIISVRQDDGTLVETYADKVVGDVQGIDFDDTGNMYTSGPDGIRKFDTNGEQVWRWPEADGSYWTLGGVATAPDGSVYGYGGGLYKFNAETGEVIWNDENYTQSFPRIAVDTSSNVYIPQNTGNNIHKFSAAGNLVWTFDGHTDNTRSPVVDSQGFVYSGSWDGTVKKIDPDLGTEVWSHTIGANVNELAVGAGDRIYGQSGPVEDKQWFLLESDGTPVFQNEILEIEGTRYRIENIATHPDGSVYLNGYEGMDGIVVKFNDQHQIQWVYTDSTGFGLYYVWASLKVGAYPSRW